MSQSVSMTQRAAAAPRRVAMRTQRGGAVARSSRAVVRAGRFETERTYIMIKCARDARRDATRRDGDGEARGRGARERLQGSGVTRRREARRDGEGRRARLTTRDVDSFDAKP